MNKPSHLSAILQAVFITFLWSTSWVLIKIGLRGSLPPVTFAGLRYVLASLCLAPFVLLNTKHRASLSSLSSSDFGKLALLGIVTYTLTQSLSYIGLAYLSAATLSLVLNLTAVFVAIAGIFLLKELPSYMQWIGVGIAVIGVGIYFLPMELPKTESFGLIVAGICMLTNVAAALYGRQINRLDTIAPLLVTFVSMAIGGALMLGVGLSVQGSGNLTLRDWGIIAWLAVVNTAFAFTVWNNTLRTLTAVESSILNSLMMPQTVILAVIFLEENLKIKDIVGLVLVFVGVIVVQLKRHTRG